MKKLLLIALGICMLSVALAQEKRSPVKSDLPDLKKSMRIAVENLPLYTQNLGAHALEHDVNTIILDIERYIDSMPKTKKYSDVLLMKNFDPLRHFFLTTSNKTTVASSFLYADAPYRFCMYNDTALALHLWALRDGDVYNLSKMTERRITRVAFENCLLPSMKALDEFKSGNIKYIAMSIYYGCKDTREGASTAVTPYCLTLVARLSDIQQYEAGLVTAKGLLANAEVYISNEDLAGEFRKVQIDADK